MCVLKQILIREDLVSLDQASWLPLKNRTSCCVKAENVACGTSATSSSIVEARRSHFSLWHFLFGVKRSDGLR